MNITSPERVLTYRDVLQNRNFALLWIGQSVSLIGDALFIYAINWYILEKTGSALQIGGNVILTVASGVIFSSIAGVMADRWNRRQIMIVSDVIRGVILLALLFSMLANIFNIWLIYTTTFVLTAVSAFFSPAHQSLIPNILKKEELVIGRALTISSSRLLQAASVAFGGILIAVLGTQVAVIINAFSFFISATTLIFINASQSAQKINSDKPILISFYRDGLSGWYYIRSIPVLISLFVLFSFTEFGAAFTWPVHAVFVEKVLGGGPDLYGYLSTASLLGSFAGAYFIGRFNTWFNRHPGWSFALAAFLWGILSITFSQTTSVPFALGLRFLIGISLSMIHVPISALLDITVSEEFRGRVWATIGIGNRIAGATATFLSGILADQTTPRLSYLIAGLILVLAAVLSILLKPIRSAQIVKQE